MNKNRKTSLQIFIRKAIPSLLVYGLLLAIMLPTFCQNQQNSFLNEYAGIMSSLVSDQLTENDDPTKLPFTLAFRTIEQTEALKSHAWITDTETGEPIASSDKVFFWAQTQKDADGDGEKEKPILRRCDYDVIKQDLGEYVDRHPKNAILDASGYLYPIYPLKGYEKYLYYYCMEDVYYTDTTFYPGTLNIENSEDGISDFSSLKQIVSLTLAPENPEDYEHMQLNEDNDGLNPIVIGDSYCVEDFPLAVESLKKELGSEAYTTTLCRTGITEMYRRHNYTDALGNNYTLHFALKLDYWAVAGRYILALAVIIGLLILGVVAIVSKKEYNTLRFFYQKNDYRKSLMDAMAHDLKTPLMAMSGYAENLKENVNTDKRDHYVDAILQNTNYMNEIISRNLTLSEFETMTDLPKQESIEITALCKDLMKKYEMSLEEKHCKFNITGNYTVKGNREYLTIALDNLLSNAVKYTNPHGSIEIDGQQRLLTIANTTDQKLSGSPNKLWEPFVKGDESRSNQKGTGLGLAIAKSILDMHNLDSLITTTEREDLTLFTIAIKK